MMAVRCLADERFFAFFCGNAGRFAWVAARTMETFMSAADAQAAAGPRKRKAKRRKRA